MPPDDENISSPEGAQNTSSPEGAQNTSSPEGAQNTAPAVDQFGNGIQEGIRRFAKKLGLPTDPALAAEQIEQLKRGAQEKAKTDEEQRRIDIEHKENALHQQIALWQQRASVAKQAQLQALALESGVGKGAQLEAFTKLFANEFAFSDRDGAFDRLVVIGESNGVTVEMPTTPADRVKQILEQHNYLRAALSDRGEGATIGPIGGGVDTSFLADPFGGLARKNKGG